MLTIPINQILSLLLKTFENLRFRRHKKIWTLRMISLFENKRKSEKLDKTGRRKCLRLDRKVG